MIYAILVQVFNKGVACNKDRHSVDNILTVCRQTWKLDAGMKFTVHSLIDNFQSLVDRCFCSDEKVRSDFTDSVKR